MASESEYVPPVDNEAQKQGGGFGVYPRTNCPHIQLCVSPVLEFELTDACVDCGNTGENWACLCCSKVFCSRYVRGHMKQHHERLKLRHAIAFSFSDFSFWCFECDDYITSPALRPILSAAQRARFEANTSTAATPASTSQQSQHDGAEEDAHGSS